MDGLKSFYSLQCVSFVLLLVVLSSCRTVTEGDAAAKPEKTGGVSVVAVQYVASESSPCPRFTVPSHFMV